MLSSQFKHFEKKHTPTLEQVVARTWNVPRVVVGEKGAKGAKRRKQDAELFQRPRGRGLFW